MAGVPDAGGDAYVCLRGEWHTVNTTLRWNSRLAEANAILCQRLLARVRCTWRSVVRRAERRGDPVTNAIKGALHSVWIEVYLLTDSRVIGALEEDAQRGVDVRVMLEEHPFGGDVVSPQRTLQTLNTAGIHAQFADPAYYYTHAKMLIIDNATLFVLTANLTRSALGGSSVTRNREFGVIDTHADDVAEALAIFQADWTHTRPVLHDANMVVSPVNARARSPRSSLWRGHRSSLRMRRCTTPPRRMR